MECARQHQLSIIFCIYHSEKYNRFADRLIVNNDFPLPLIDFPLQQYLLDVTSRGGATIEAAVMHPHHFQILMFYCLDPPPLPSNALPPPLTFKFVVPPLVTSNKVFVIQEAG